MADPLDFAFLRVRFGAALFNMLSIHFANEAFEPRIHSITPSCVRFLNKKLISGFSFKLSGSRTIDIGYIITRHEMPIDSDACPNV